MFLVVGVVCNLIRTQGCRNTSKILGTLRYEDGKARTGTAMDAGNFRGSRCVAKNKMLKMCIFAKDCDVKNSNFEKRYSQKQ